MQLPTLRILLNLFSRIQSFRLEYRKKAMNKRPNQRAREVICQRAEMKAPLLHVACPILHSDYFGLNIKILNSQIIRHLAFIFAKKHLFWSICYTSPFSGIVAVQDNWIISGMHARKANGPMTQRAYWCAIQLYSWQGTPAPFCLSYLAKSTLRIGDRFNSCSLQ